MGLIELEGMEFRAHHGCFKEERIIGNSFIVYFSFEADSSEAEQTDNLEKTVNYQTVYNLIKDEMEKPSHLLEHVSRRIMDKVTSQFPSITKAKVKVSKLNPAMGGKLGCISVTVDFTKL
jgi:dihydroneopterin aldolase